MSQTSRRPLSFIHAYIMQARKTYTLRTALSLVTPPPHSPPSPAAVRGRGRGGAQVRKTGSVVNTTAEQTYMLPPPSQLNRAIPFINGLYFLLILFRALNMYQHIWALLFLIPYLRHQYTFKCGSNALNNPYTKSWQVQNHVWEHCF